MRTELTIEDLAPGGEGVGHAGARTVFVPWTAPGDRVVADVQDGDGTAHGSLVSLEAPGPVRVPAPCVHFGPGEIPGLPGAPGGPASRPRHEVPGISARAQARPDEAASERAGGPGGPASRPRHEVPGISARAQARPDEAASERAGGPGGPASRPPRYDDGCGGCEWLHVDYPTQLAAKERTVREALRRIARVEPGAYDARPIVGSPAPLRYRARAKFHHDRASGRLVYFRRRSHAPVRLRECHLLDERLDALREAVGPALGRAGLAPREVALEWSGHEGRGAAWLLVPAITPAVRTRAEALLGDVPALAGAVLQPEGGPPVLLGNPVLRHARVPGDAASGLQRSRPDVFQQANRGANALLVRAALDLLAPEGADVLELHCGAGNFTGPLAARARSVAAVEVQGPALELARADLAGAGNVRFFAGDALKLALAFAREAGPSARRFGAVLLDPPREGAKGIGPALRELGLPRTVYVSCDPATFARDIRACVETGYRLEAVQPVDMFPQTHHVEAVALLVPP